MTAGVSRRAVQGRLPDFLIIGGMRCGSTTLANLLRSQDGLFLPQRKEVHYFDQRNVQLNSLEQYAAVFESASPDQLVGEATPDYLSTPGCAERVHRAVPGAKLVIILRDPVMRAWSHYRLSVHMGHEIEPFERALGLEDERLGRPIHAHDVLFSYRQRGRYIEHIERFLDCFSRDCLHVLFLEDLCRDPDHVTRALFRFLGVDRVDSWRGALAVTNQAPLVSAVAQPNAARERQRRWRREIVRRVSAYAQRLAPRTWRYDVGRSIEHSFLNQERLNPETARQLAAYFRPFDQRLAQFLERPLPWFDPGSSRR